MWGSSSLGRALVPNPVLSLFGEPSGCLALQRQFEKTLCGVGLWAVDCAAESAYQRAPYRERRPLLILTHARVHRPATGTSFSHSSDTPLAIQWHPIQSRYSAYKSAAWAGPEKNPRIPSTTPDNQITNAVFWSERRTMRPPRSLKMACSDGDRQRSTGTETGNRSHSFSFFFRTDRESDNIRFLPSRKSILTMFKMYVYV